MRFTVKVHSSDGSVSNDKFEYGSWKVAKEAVTFNLKGNGYPDWVKAIEIGSDEDPDHNIWIFK